MPAMLFACPSCGAKLKLNELAPENKKMRCPRCKTISPLRETRPIAVAAKPSAPRPVAKAGPKPELKSPTSPVRKAPPPAPLEEVDELDPVLDEPIDLETHSGPPSRKSGLDVTAIVVAVTVVAYLGAAATSFLGMFDGR
jgi:predicted Zn finger-like uncharacterized protein